MDKLPRSGPLYNAVEEIYSRENLFDQTRTMPEVIKESAKKYNVPVEQLKKVLPDANQVFEGGPLSNPKAPSDVYLKNASGTGKSRTMIEMLAKMTPEARANVLSNRNAFDSIEKFILKAPAAKEMVQIGGGMNTLGKAIGPAFAVAEGGLAAQGVYDKMKAGESFKEATSNPELVKNAARGVLGYMGGDVGAALGVAGSSMLPGGLPVKLATEIGSAVGGAYLGTKLADLLTGNPVLDKIIRDRYEKARNERMAQTKPTAASSVALRPGE
jgi:hypothetical protein